MTLTCLAQLSQWAPCYSYIGTLGLFVCTWFPFSSLCGKRKGWVFFKKRIKLFTFFNSLRRSIPYRLVNFAKFSISAETLQIFANRTLRRYDASLSPRRWHDQSTYHSSYNNKANIGKHLTFLRVWFRLNVEISLSNIEIRRPKCPEFSISVPYPLG